MMGNEELACNIEIALHILENLSGDVIDAIDYARDGHGNKELASFLAEKAMEFRGNEEFDGQFGSTHNDVCEFVNELQYVWIRKIAEEGVQDWG